MQTPLPSPFYRVTIKALIFDDSNRLLVVENENSRWELPGGGWEHDETIEECIRREILEELGVALDTHDPQVAFIYRGISQKGYHVVRIAVKAKLASHEFVPADGMQSAKFVTASELGKLEMAPDEAGIVECVEQIWPPVEKNGPNL